MSAKKTYTLAEVKQHNTKTDLWVIIHDKVYDVTRFLSEVSFIGFSMRIFFLLNKIQIERINKANCLFFFIASWW